MTSQSSSSSSSKRRIIISASLLFYASLQIQTVNTFPLSSRRLSFLYSSPSYSSSIFSLRRFNSYSNYDLNCVHDIKVRGEDSEKNVTENKQSFLNLVRQCARDCSKVVTLSAVAAACIFGSPIIADADDFGAINRVNALEEVYSLVDKYYLRKNEVQSKLDKTHEEFAQQLAGKAFGENGSKADGADVMDYATKLAKVLNDKYSRVLSIENYERMQKYDLIGVGAMLMPDNSGKIMVGAPPVSKSAADRAGVKAGDFVMAVNGVSTEGRTSFQIIDQISDDPNAKSILMKFRRVGENDLPDEGTIREIELEREFEEVKDPISYSLSKNDDGRNVGYVRIKEFNSLVKSRLYNALDTLEKQGANAYVLDLRGNPGGAFQSAVNIAGFFLSEKTATNVIDNKGVELPFTTPKDEVVVDASDPMVIWVDKGSASASEVLAGALHDNCRATVMGENSFGKGLIQAVYGLKNGGGLVLTVAKYITPGGNDIQGVGIIPDISTSLPTIPGFRSDTSKVDFKDVERRQAFCINHQQ